VSGSPGDFEREFEALPDAVRALLAAELAAGNTVTEVGHSFPAPPTGVWFMLASPVRTRPRASGAGLSFRERRSSLCSGEFCDEARRAFVLEPPLPPPAEPDMDAIRARSAAIPPARCAVPAAGGALERFRRSMELDRDRWRDGIGYDLDTLAAADPAERAAIEALLVARGARDWRDVEALAAVDGERARALLREVAAGADQRLRVAVLAAAPELLAEPQRTAILVDALERAESGGGLTQALLLAEDRHPAEVVDALFRGLLARDGTTAVQFAALLMFVHGRAGAAFDIGQRDYLLRFCTEDPAQRRAMLRDLRARLGLPAARFLPPERT
jgi:hypothetical protein